VPWNHDAPAPIETLFSLPGEWIDRTGRPRPRVPLKRIAVIKPDHIGDLLIAAKALVLLRHFFPDAQIDLICGPWNVGLAQQMKLFDNVYGVNLFHEVSGQQSDLGVARQARRAGVAKLAELQLGRYDLALDLRYDLDSRLALLILDAQLYAGFGNTKQLPFLDIAVPMAPHDGWPHSTHEVFLGGDHFRHGGTAHGAGFPGTGLLPGGVIDVERNFIELDIMSSGAKSPQQCGTVSNDQRPLSVALTSVQLSPLVELTGGDDWEPITLLPTDPRVTLVSGWADLEDWGVWGIGNSCRVRIAIPPSRGESSLFVRLCLVGHVNFNNKAVQCQVRAGDDEPAGAVEFKYPKNSESVSFAASRLQEKVTLLSEPFRTNPGHYRGILRLHIPHRTVSEQARLTLTLRGTESDATLLVRHISVPELEGGLCDVRFDCQVETSPEPLIFQLDTHTASALRGTRIEMLTMRCVAQTKTNIPVSHMETLASLLVLRVALEFSDVAPFNGDPIAERLAAAAPADGSEASVSAQELCSRLRHWKHQGYCVLAVALGCNSDIRKWSYSYFVELCRVILEIGRVKLVFIGAPSDEEEALAACRQLGLDPAEANLCGKTRLADLGKLLKELDLFVGNNTGTTHFAGRLGVRAIGIYSGTNHPKEWGPIGENASWITRDVPCAPCFLSQVRDCHHGLVCLKDLLPQDVLKVVIPEIMTTLSARRVALARNSPRAVTVSFEAGS
jgi:ADP-heptose:LPS heptosyltransferase